MPLEAKGGEHIENLGIGEGQEPAWTMHIDGASNKNGAGVGVVLKSPEGTILELGVRLGFEASNNESEYEAIILGLKRAKALCIENLRIYCDSQLVANQLMGEYCARNQKMEST